MSNEEVCLNCPKALLLSPVNFACMLEASQGKKGFRHKKKTKCYDNDWEANRKKYLLIKNFKKD